MSEGVQYDYLPARTHSNPVDYVDEYIWTKRNLSGKVAGECFPGVFLCLIFQIELKQILNVFLIFFIEIN